MAPESLAAGPYQIELAKNPLTPEPLADLTVLRVDQPELLYVMTGTVGTDDAPIYVSSDLVRWKKHGYLFGGAERFNRGYPKGKPLLFKTGALCPRSVGIHHSKTLKKYVAYFGAIPVENGRCGNDRDIQLYVATSDSPTGPFGTATGEPFALSATCPKLSKGLEGSYDGSVVWNHSGAPWLAYSRVNKQGYATYLTRLRANRPTHLLCQDTNIPKRLVSPKNPKLLEELSRSSELGDFKLGFNYNREDAPLRYIHGVIEGTEIFWHPLKHLYYAIFSANSYRSSYYQTFWVAAKSIRGLRDRAKNRLSGRHLLMSGTRNVGHGSVVEGPAGDFYYVAHVMPTQELCRLESSQQPPRACARYPYLFPMNFEDRGDSEGAPFLAPTVLDEVEDVFTEVITRRNR